MHERTIILTFHGVGEPARPLEPGEARVWLTVDRFESVLDSIAGRPEIRLTFDDGNASDLELALPRLRGRGLTATFFVLAGRLGEPGFLDEDGVRKLAAAGMGIGCHGMSHRPWRRLAPRALDEELVDSRRVLERILDRPVREAACPFGSYDRRVLRSLRRHGYRRAFTSDCGTARPDDWIQARNTVGPANADGLIDGIVAAEASTSHLVRRRARLAAKRWR